MKRAMLLLALIALVFAAEAASAQKNVPYVATGTAAQTMDVYWPAAAPKAAVLFIHGGSLQEGGERRTSPVYAHVCDPFVSSGFACASIDYRLSPANKWPAMPDDVAASIVKMRQLMAEHKADPHRLFLFGHSSGCQLAAIVSSNADYLERVGLAPADLAGVIAMGCTLDREDAALRHLTADVIRGPLSQDAEEMATYGTVENWLSANPASFIGKHVPPTLVVVAEAERFAPPILEQGSRYVRLLLEAGVKADLVIVPGRHMTSIAGIAKAEDPTFAAIRKFMRNAGAASR